MSHTKTCTVPGPAQATLHKPVIAAFKVNKLQGLRHYQLNSNHIKQTSHLNSTGKLINSKTVFLAVNAFSRPYGGPAFIP